MTSIPQKQVVIVQIPKSPVLAAVLGFFFGPLGLLYASLRSAILMFFVNLAVAVFTAGFGLIFAWPLCAIVGWSAASAANKKMMAGTS